MINPIFEPLWNTPEHIELILISSGRGTGKSFTTAVHATDRLTDASTYTRGLLLRQNHDSLKDSIIAGINDVLQNTLSEKELKKIKITKKPYEFVCGKNSLTGKGFTTKGDSSTAKMKSLSDFNYIIIEEAEEIKEEDFDKLMDSIRTTKGRCLIILLFNPPHANHWINRRFHDLIPCGVPGYFDYKLKDIHKFNTLEIRPNLEDNKHNITESAYRRYMNYKEINPTHYYTHIMGLVSEIKTGLIFDPVKECYPSFYESIEAFERFGCDFGSVDPTTLVGCKVYENKLYVHEYVYSSFLTARDICGLFNRVTTDTIMADNQARQLIDTLYYDYNMSNVVPCEKGAGSVMAGIKKIQSYDEIIVTTTSKNTLEEFSQYAYALNRDKLPVDKPKDEHNHAIDALRYALQSPEVQFYCFV